MSGPRNIFSKKIVLSGLPEGLDASFLVKKIKKDGSSFLHIARDDARALAIKTAVK